MKPPGLKSRNRTATLPANQAASPELVTFRDFGERTQEVVLRE